MSTVCMVCGAGRAFLKPFVAESKHMKMISREEKHGGAEGKRALVSADNANVGLRLKQIYRAFGDIIFVL